MKKIPLKNGKNILVDDEDYPVLSRFNWSLSNGGVPFAYVRNGLQIEIMRFLMKSDYCLEVSHKDRDNLNNQKENLFYISRERITRWRGRKKTKKLSKYKGVYQNFLGYFWTEEDAAEAYNKKSKELHGEFAYQNKLEL